MYIVEEIGKPAMMMNYEVLDFVSLADERVEFVGIVRDKKEENDG